MRVGRSGIRRGRGARNLLLALCAGIAGFADHALGQSPAAVPGEALTFTAMGNEPGWRLDIGGGRMVLTIDYGATTMSMPTPSPEPVPGGRAYIADEAGRPVRVTVTDRICDDTMTGMPRPATVSIEFDGRKLDGCGGEPASLLRGGAWVVESIDGAPSIPDAKPTVTFGDDGSLSGHATCNGYSGTYLLTGEGLTVSRLVSTMKACPSQQQQEDAFLAILREVLRFERPPEGALVLHTAGGRTIRGRRGATIEK